MSTGPWWDDGRPSGRSSGVRRPKEPASQFRPWPVAAISFFVQKAVFLVTMFVFLMAFVVSAPIFGIAGIGDSFTERGLLIFLVSVAIAVLGFSVHLQARYIRRRGGQQPVIACVVALIAALLLGVVGDLAGLPNLIAGVGVCVVEVALIALLIQPDQR